MSLYSYKNISPQIGEKCFIADSADIIGRVKIGKLANIWFQVVVRGDVNDIIIGENSNIQDLSMLHVIDQLPLIIGNNVSVGHAAILHACTIEDHCLVGMGATILDGAIIGKNSLVAAHSLVPPGKIYPAGSFIVGSPAQAIRPLREAELELYGNHYKSYLETASEYRNHQVVKKIE